jgi:hypothetical protein
MNSVRSINAGKTFPVASVQGRRPWLSFFFRMLLVFYFCVIPLSTVYAGIVQVNTLVHDAADATYSSLVKIDDTRYIMAYVGTNSDGYIKTFSIDSNYKITQIASLAHDQASDCSYNSLVMLDSTHFALAYQASGVGGVIKIFSTNASYSAITQESVSTHDASMGRFNSLVAIDSTHLILAYASGSFYDGYIKTFSIDPANIVPALNYKINQIDSELNDIADGCYNSLVKISSTRFMLAYQGGGNDGIIKTISVDPTIYNNIAVLNTLKHDEYVYDNSLVNIDNTYFILTYATTGSDGVIVTFSINGSYAITEITSLTHETGAAGEAEYNSLIMIDATNFMLAYKGADSDGYIKTFSTSPSYNSIAATGSLEHDKNDATYNTLVKIDAGHYMLAYAGLYSDGYIKTFGTPEVIYYSVGTNAAALYSGNASALVAGTLTLASAAAANIGVGDEVRVGSNRYYITGRTSSTVFSIQNSAANGGTPGSTAITFASTAITIYRAFNTLSLAESGSSNASHLNTANLVTGNYQLNWTCYADGEDSTAVTVDGWTTAGRNFIRIYTPTATSEVGQTQRHTGKWGDGYRRTAAITVSDEHVRLDGISISQTGTDTAYRVTGTSAAGDVWISSCFGVNASTSANHVYQFDTVAATTLKIWNSIGISKAAGYSAFYFNDADLTAYVYNATAVCSTSGACVAFNRNAGSVTIKNGLGVDNAGASQSAFSSGMTVTYSASDDDTADDAGGAGNRINQTFSFLNTANDNFHLQGTDTGALNYGTSLLTDAYIPFATDIDGDVRPMESVWEIGADEVQSKSSSMMAGMDF